MKYFDYGQKELDYLKNCDKVLGEYIDRVGYLQREMHDDLFECLVSSIIGQQISGKAVATILDRLQNRVGDIVTPQSLYKLSVEEIQSCGMSTRKATNLHSLAKKVVEGEICFDRLADVSDEQIVEKLVSLDGVGVWTAEMALIFAFGRKNVMSYGDFGIKKGLCLLYGIDKLDKKTFDFYRQKFAPYGSVASFYLWHKANGN